MEASFPKEMPETLTVKAIVHESEAAWDRDTALEVVQWCHEKDLAVVGAELWLKKGQKIQQGIITDSGLEVFEWNTDPQRQEPWEAFHARSISEAREFIRSFRWPEQACDPEQNAYFYLVIIDELWLEQYLSEPGF